MTDEEIFELFNGRCILCWHPATEINHIVLRSRSQVLIDDWHNKVTLCQFCHEQYHKHGVTKDKENFMKQARAEFLCAIGKEEYV